MEKAIDSGTRLTTGNSSGSNRKESVKDGDWLPPTAIARRHKCFVDDDKEPCVMLRPRKQGTQRFSCLPNGIQEARQEVGCQP